MSNCTSIGHTVYPIPRVIVRAHQKGKNFLRVIFLAHMMQFGPTKNNM